MAFPKDIASYCQFMEEVATDMKLLQHGLDNGNGQSEAYGEVWISTDPINKIDWRSFFNQFKSKIKYPCLINLGVTFDSQGDNGNVYTSDAKFAIVMKLGNGDLSQQRKACFQTCEQIAREILQRNRAYFGANIHLGWMADKATTEPIGPINVDGPLYGVVVNFDYYVKETECYNPQLWETEIKTEA